MSRLNKKYLTMLAGLYLVVSLKELWLLKSGVDFYIKLRYVWLYSRRFFFFLKERTPLVLFLRNTSYSTSRITSSKTILVSKTQRVS